jgi:hypothetical protein
MATCEYRRVNRSISKSIARSMARLPGHCHRLHPADRLPVDPLLPGGIPATAPPARRPHRRGPGPPLPRSVVPNWHICVQGSRYRIVNAAVNTRRVSEFLVARSFRHCRCMAGFGRSEHDHLCPRPDTHLRYMINIALDHEVFACWAVRDERGRPGRQVVNSAGRARLTAARRRFPRWRDGCRALASWRCARSDATPRQVRRPGSGMSIPLRYLVTE